MAGPHMEGQTFNCIGAKLRGTGNILLNWLGRYDLPGPGWQLFSGIFSQEKSCKIFASCNSKDFWIPLCLAQSAEVTILSCAAVSVEPLLKAHTDSLEALFASCKTLRLDSVKVRVAGKFSPCVLFSGPNLKILE